MHSTVSNNLKDLTCASGSKTKRQINYNISPPLQPPRISFLVNVNKESQLAIPCIFREAPGPLSLSSKVIIKELKWRNNLDKAQVCELKVRLCFVFPAQLLQPVTRPVFYHHPTYIQLAHVEDQIQRSHKLGVSLLTYCYSCDLTPP